MSFIRELHRQLTHKERSAVEIATETLERLQTLEPQLQSFLHITADRAMETAKRVDEKIAVGDSIGVACWCANWD